MKNISVGLCMIFFSISLFPQGVFESSLSNTHEINVSSLLSMGGFIRSATYIARTPVEEALYLQSCYGQAGLKMSAPLGEHVSASSDIRFRYGTEFSKTIHEFELREAYVDLFVGPLGFRFGKQIVSWGKGTVYNPTQRITPIDPLYRSPDRDDMKLGNWAIMTNLNLGSKTKFSGYWLPVYKPSVLLIEPVPMPDYIRFQTDAFPDARLKNGSYGLKYELFLNQFDASFSWFDGYSHWPGITYLSAVFDTITYEPAEIGLAEKAYNIQALGLDFAIPFGSWIFRFEGAWQTTQAYDEKEYIPYPELAYTAELERTGTNLNMMAGYYGKYITDFASLERSPELTFDSNMLIELLQAGITVTPEIIDNEIASRIKSFNRLYNYQTEEFYQSALAVLTGNFFYEKLELSLPVIYNFTTEEWTIRPALTYKPYDGIHLQAGYEGYYGPEGSLYDLIGPVLNSGFMAVKVIF
ncbi:MAG: hypothetical protein JXA39_06275 [Bacteroidales bacterium]|nr:hypothetical protein [Bacteroidales bacterium]